MDRHQRVTKQDHRGRGYSVYGGVSYYVGGPSNYTLCEVFYGVYSLQVGRRSRSYSSKAKPILCHKVNLYQVRLLHVLTSIITRRGKHTPPICPSQPYWVMGLFMAFEYFARDCILPCARVWRTPVLMYIFCSIFSLFNTEGGFRRAVIAIRLRSLSRSI